MAIYGQADTQILGGGAGFGGFGGGCAYPMPYPIPCYGGGYGGGYGNGYCGGFGGFGEALVLGALVGGNGFFGNNRCCDKNEHFHFDGHHNGHCGGHNGHHTEEVILDDAHYNSLQGAIAGVKDNINTLGLNIGDKFAATNAAIANVNYNQAINTKDIIHDIDIQTCAINHNIDKTSCATNANIAQTKFELSKQLSDCCCKLEAEGLKNTQAILNKLCDNEIQALRDRLCRCEKDNDNFRLVNSVVSSFRANTVGSNFNTGVQSTSTNSGQING